MKFINITLLFVIFALACTALAQDDAAAPANKRITPRRPLGKSAKSTTAAPPPADEEGDYPDENVDNQYAEEGEEAGGDSSSTTTSTEPPKKIGPVIRPFRSNDDFLNSLKRRQMDAKKTRSEKPAPKSKPAPAASEDGGEAEESAPAPAPAPGKAIKAGNPALNRRKFTKPGKPEPQAEDATPEESEQPKEDEKAKRPLSRLTQRKRA